MQKITLSDFHESIGGKMVDFAGFYMPVRYSSDKEEHLAVRNSVGVFDVSHMGEFLLKGKGALDLIQKVTSNDASTLFDGKIQYSYLPNETGGVVDDLLVYRVSEEEYLLVVNAGNIKKDWDWISKYNTEGVEMTDLSPETSLFAVQGPNAVKTLQKLTDIDLSTISYYTFVKGKFAGHEDILISATGYTGAGGFEIYLPNAIAEEVWKKIFEAGAEFDIKPIGLGARDTLRLEMGYCLYGNDITDETSPLEAGLGWVTKFTKEFTNSAALKAEKEAGLKRKLVAIEIIDKGIPRSHYEICTADGEKIGEVTSGTMSPSLNKGIALGYVSAAYSKVGTEVYIKIREKLTAAKVVKLPFVGQNV
ncbi:glycine cleavage system T protein [Leadbetterella byssophila DSM 17132]|jgi:aminomethyltransferase|uniref:Aminomethyltransferase n=1 Tax=Leadbetterella byssophila (strain DSM 17132 / JCM 16389 / KACC 11308 / NBRC 106382 / 4M15) TaxID=649349 RepID=E4RYZ5_LEAB4|nr:glycine cleavage system aminomethyltransferase GcvT [Leadbetterella byssophila]ADQ18214.1 glycine cleavage system T protein [Leadbetterella byssophila DSM 17132]